MRKLSLAGIAALALAASLAGSTRASAQQPEAEPSKSEPAPQAPINGKVFGYMDPESGKFSPLNRTTPDATTAPVTGTIQVTASITLKTPVPAGYGVYCFTEIDALDLTTTGEIAYSESTLTTAKVTGATATCTVNTPYSWAIPSADLSTGKLEGIYEVALIPTTEEGKELLNLEFNDRASIGFFLREAKIPATGATTKVALAVTL